MLWKFSFSGSVSTLDTLLSRESPPSVEELLDEQDILAECKAQNNKLVTYLSREESVKSLLGWVTSGLDELDSQAEKEEDEAYQKALQSEDAYPAYKADDSAKASPATPRVPTPPLSPSSPSRVPAGIGLGEGLGGQEESGSDTNRTRYPSIAAEILTSELWTIPETIMNHKDTLLRPFWDQVVLPLDPSPRSARERTERERARLAYWTEEDEERERKREVIRGMWMRVNASLLQKRTTEMIRFIQSIPDVIERMIARIESPAIQDMLARIIQSEEAGVSDVMSWLGEQRLVPRLLALLSPDYPSSTHAIAADLLKGIISVSAPNSSFNPSGGNAMDQQGGLQQGGTRDNRLVRELTNKESIETLVGYLLNPVQLTDSAWTGVNGDGPGTNRADPFIIHPLPSVASATSSLCNVCNVIVEVIRRNNSDLAEPYLFNTMRNRLMAIQSEQMQASEPAPDASPKTQPEKSHAEREDESRDKMEAALPGLADRLAIVHLGNLVAAIADRFEDLNKILAAPRSQPRVKSELTQKPLTMERFRVIELYAELLHSSNMATLNRVTGSGPDYSAEGALTGGLDGLDRLGHALQTGEAGEDDDASPSPPPEVHPARELPVSSGSTDYSLTESDDVPLSNEDDKDKAPKEVKEPTESKDAKDAKATEATEATESTESTPVAKAAAQLQELIPPPASDADAERLRKVLLTPDAPVSDTPLSMMSETGAQAGTTAKAPSLETTGPLSTGERLKQQFISYGVLATLLDLFFEYSQNNFLHHLVYDILQQILNGNLGKGANRDLVVDLFTRAHLIDRVLAAQRMNDAVVAAAKPRLAYMGHISLIAEEIVRFLDKAPADLRAAIQPSFSEDAWDAFVAGSLRETRDRDNAPLAGGKPGPGLGSGISATSERSDSESDDDDERGQSFGEPLSRTIGKQATDSYHDSGADEDGSMDQFWPPRNARSVGMDSSDDDDDDADWLRPGNRDGEDDFGSFQSTTQHNDLDDDDAWGAFTSVNTSDSADNPFSDDAFSPSSSSDAYRSAEPLTPRDWAEAFDREFDNSEPPSDEPIVLPTPDEETGPSWSFPDEPSAIGELPPVLTAHTTSPPPVSTHTPASPSAVGSMSEQTGNLRLSETPAQHAHNESLHTHFAAQPAPEQTSESQTEDLDRLASASTKENPLGLGVSKDTHVGSDGKLYRRMPDGSVVSAPEDDVAMGIEDAREGKLGKREQERVDANLGQEGCEPSAPAKR